MAFAELSDLEDRLEWDLSDGEKRVGQTALEDLSVDACQHGAQWTDANVPQYVKRVVLAAAVRYMRNLEGVVQSRAGDETLIFNEIKEGAGSASFTTAEIEAIISIAQGPQGFGTIPIVAWSEGPDPLSGWVPTVPQGKLFPMYAADDPW